MVFDAGDNAAAEAKVDEACKKLLANLIMETYRYTITSVAE
jgi:phosphoribosylformylglycinamidine (FGAM) synthase PurS component